MLEYFKPFGVSYGLTPDRYRLDQAILTARAERFGLHREQFLESQGIVFSKDGRRVILFPREDGGYSKELDVQNEKKYVPGAVISRAAAVTVETAHGNPGTPVSALFFSRLKDRFRLAIPGRPATLRSSLADALYFEVAMKVYPDPAQTSGPVSHRTPPRFRLLVGLSRLEVADPEKRLQKGIRMLLNVLETSPFSLQESWTIPSDPGGDGSGLLVTVADRAPLNAALLKGFKWVDRSGSPGSRSPEHAQAQPVSEAAL